MHAQAEVLAFQEGSLHLVSLDLSELKLDGVISVGMEGYTYTE